MAVVYGMFNFAKHLLDRVCHPVGPERAHHAQPLQRRLVLPLLRELLLLRTLALGKLLPALGRALDVAVQVAELVHVDERLDAAPRLVAEEVDGAGEVGHTGEAQQEL